MRELKIDPEFQSLIPPLSDEEYRQLEVNIQAEGCRDALVVWNDVIVDGHNRYKICQANNIQYQTMDKQFPGRQAATTWIIHNQFGRRNLTAAQRVELALKLKPLIQGKAKERMIAGVKDPTQKSAGGETRKELAKLAGVSHDTLAKGEKIFTQGTEDQKQRARKGGQGNSVNSIYREVVSKSTEPSAPKEDMKVCIKCGEPLPVKMFYKGRNTCKSCVAQYDRKKSRDWKGDVVTISPEIAKMTEAEIIGDLYNTEKEVVHTIEDGIRDFTCNFETFFNILDGILEDYKEFLKEPENNKKMMAVLSQAVAAMSELKGKYSYERL